MVAAKGSQKKTTRTTHILIYIFASMATPTNPWANRVIFRISLCRALCRVFMHSAYRKLSPSLIPSSPYPSTCQELIVQNIATGYCGYSGYI